MNEVAPAASPVEPARKARKYKVINPRTGEEIVIRSTVPFHQRPSKRLRILDPRTGEEVLPRSYNGKSEKLEDDADARQAPPAALARVATPLRASCRRDTNASRRESCGGESAEVSSRRSGPSMVGRAVREGSAWALEPASGGHWDWPLSRQEKKDRVLLLTQLELLAEVEELRDEARR